MQIKLKSKIPIIYISLLLVLMIYALYKDLIIHKDLANNYYNKYYYLFSFLFILSSILFFFDQKKNKNILLLIVSIFLSFYLLEICLRLYKINADFIIGNNYDNRSVLQVLDDERKKNNRTVISFIPSLFLNYENIIPVSGVSKRRTVFCNENGYYAIYDSDRYGFNNIDTNWDGNKIDILLIGDSHVQGNCVNYNDTYAGNLKSLNPQKKIINAGMRANGPLLELASLTEILKLEKEIHDVVWIITENDISNISSEKNNQILMNYLEDINYSQNILNKQNIVDTLILKKHDEYVLNERNKKQIDYKSLIKLTKLRLLIFERLFPTSSHSVNLVNKNDLKIFIEIVDRFFNLSYKYEFNLHIFYMPHVTEFTEKKNRTNAYFKDLASSFQTLFDYVEKKNNKVHNLKDIFFNKQEDPLSYFNFMAKRIDKSLLDKRYGHLSEKGYKSISFIINDVINDF